MQDINITGIIMPNNWDENGKVIEIALYTNTEDVYTVENSSLKQELISLRQKKVEIKGKIRQDPNGNKSISAHSYILLDDAAEE